ncbi:MAG TPA: phosphopantetheine-binding protein [Solirubrobacteraceae bacterium]|jgi:acyl carrier protein|nr:phosphopantetheine-binding protein [Solirubrobacteraceae bacterium]
MPADATDRAQIIGEIGRIVTEVIGDDYLIDTEITASTTFVGDLELESIEFVSLAARLQDLYGERVDFVAFVTELEIDQLTDLTVGELADFIGRYLAADETPAPAAPASASASAPASASASASAPGRDG